MRIPNIPYVQGRNAYQDRDGRKYGIAIHCTANDATAEQEAAYASRRTDGVSAHFFADSDSVIQSLDTDSRAGHAGSYEGNEHAIAVEITGLVTWSRAQWLDRVAWGPLARVLAILCRHYDITPRRAKVSEMDLYPKVRAFYGHDDMRRAWGGTTHTDPGPNFPWDHLLATVEQAMTGDEDDMTPGESWALHVINYRLEALKANRPVIRVPARPDLGASYTAFEEPNLLAVAVGADQVDEHAVIAGVLAGLSPEAIAAAIPADLAQRVADELAARLAA